MFPLIHFLVFNFYSSLTYYIPTKGCPPSTLPGPSQSSSLLDQSLLHFVSKRSEGLPRIPTKYVLTKYKGTHSHFKVG